MVLATLQENLFWRNQSIIQFVSAETAENFTFATNQWINRRVLSLFGRNQQTRALKSLKATSAWNILVEVNGKSQALQTAGQSDVLQALVEKVAESQALQSAGQSNLFQALVEKIAKSQALQSARQSDVLQALVEI